MSTHAASIREVAAHLLDAGLRPGDRCAIFSANRLEWLEAAFAIQTARGVMVPIYPSSTADQARWAERVHVSLVELSGDFREHIDITEAPNRLYHDLLKTSPRLSGAVSGLTREHVMISSQVDNLLGQVTVPDLIEDVDRVRDLGTALLGRLVRHRQRGSDLVYEAYEFDIGGET